MSIPNSTVVVKPYHSSTRTNIGARNIDEAAVRKSFTYLKESVHNGSNDNRWQDIKTTFFSKNSSSSIPVEKRQVLLIEAIELSIQFVKKDLYYVSNYLWDDGCSGIFRDLISDESSILTPENDTPEVLTNKIVEFIKNIAQ